jgi:hypothetical protein
MIEVKGCNKGVNDAHESVTVNIISVETSVDVAGIATE